VLYHRFALAKEDAAAFAVILGKEDGELFDKAITGLPKRHVSVAVRQLLKATGCFDGLIEADDAEDSEGEASAS
jgi:hypothetical protein